MKFIIKTILVISTLILLFSEANCEGHARSKQTFNGIFKQISEMKVELVPHMKFIQHTDLDCVKDFLKLPQNGEILAKSNEDFFISSTAIIKCLGDHGDEYIKTLIALMAINELKDQLDCAKIKLQQIEPTSKLIDNFNRNLNDAEHEACEKLLNEETMKDYQTQQEQDMGPVDEFSCGAMTGVNDYVKIVTKTAIINRGDCSDDVKDAELKNLIEYVKTISFKTTECIFNRLVK